jgi:hypothetical protein
MPPVPAGFVQCNFQFELVNDPELMLCTVACHTDAASTAARLAVVNEMFDNWADNLLPKQAAAYNLVAVEGLFGDAGGNIEITSTRTAAAGGAAVNALPQNCALLIRKLAAVGGHRNRGRFYVPGIGDAEVLSNGAIDPTARALWQTAANNFFLGFDSALDVGVPVILHATAPFTPTDCDQFFVDAVSATQRRRLRR